MPVERYYAGAAVALESQMKRPQSKQPSPKPTLKAKPKATPKPTSTASKPRTAATKPAPKKTVKPSPRKSATAVRKAPVPAPTRIPKPVSTDTPQSKQSQLIALLGSAAGASMVQMTALTGWQRHTVRGAISGALRKRLGLKVLCKVEEGVRIYRIAEAVAA